ncbi:MAG: chorismate-binding protein [Oscillatoriales cyanobacterium RM2_1_1]|nr:chorismate-binding protein [Oscillatoriales cyanobacterium SM2_3_0]NJO45753.1 chorismate-binding protein [Oscillatoriales cyanobacterium RM2_1_1]
MEGQLSQPQNPGINLILALAQRLAGDFSNARQAAENPKDYAHIRVFFRPLPFEFFSGIGFYSEQVYDYDIWSPYRQGIHRFCSQDNQVYIENYSLNDGFLYAGAGHEPEILKTIKPDSIQRRHHCSMVFKQENNLFLGRVEGNQCLIERDGKQTYLISTVELTETNFISWDRGFDLNTHEQVWGSAKGPLKFEKRQSFAQELPAIAP